MIPTLKEAPRNAETEPGQGGQTKQKVPKVPRSRGTVLASPELLPSSGPDGQFQIRTSHHPLPGPQRGLRALPPLTPEGCRWPAQCSQTGYRPMPRRQRCVWGMREKVTSNGHLGPPRCRQVLPTVPWASVSVTCWGLATRREQRPGGASSRTGWCWGSSQGGSWPGPQVKREAGSGGGSERAGGAPRRSGKKAKALIRMWGEQGSAPSPGRRMEGDTRGKGAVAPRGPFDSRGKGIPAHHPLLGPPYIDSAQVKPLLETQQHGAVAHWPAGRRGGGEGSWEQKEILG